MRIPASLSRILLTITLALALLGSSVGMVGAGESPGECPKLELPMYPPVEIVIGWCVSEGVGPMEGIGSGEGIGIVEIKPIPLIPGDIPSPIQGHGDRLSDTILEVFGR